MKITPVPSRTNPGESYATDFARANLRLVLLEAVAWALPRADTKNPTTGLRSAELAPYRFCASRHDIVFDVASKRHRHLVANGLVRHAGGRWDQLLEVDALGLTGVDAELATGRLLVWERDNTIDDGAGEAETGGYLDGSDMPPWDTWVAYSDSSATRVGSLVSWVPPVFVDAIDRAIRVNAYGALYWLHESKLPIAEVCRSEVLLPGA